MKRKLLAAAGAAVLIVAGVPAAASAAPDEGSGTTRLRPVVFVHGFSGSANQFQTQAKRFTANGYPDSYVDGLDYDSTFQVQTADQVYAELDRKIDALLKRSRADKVDLLGHSLGTYMSQNYLKSAPERAARVAHYVNLDGFPATELPAGVPTLAIWGEGAPTREITGAKNVYFPGQAHTETVTSKETFVEAFTFFRGKAPRTTDVRPEGVVQLSGRAVLFPSNVGVSGATLEVYRLNPRTGQRVGRAVTRQELSGDGSFGPFLALGSAHYEFAIIRPGAATHHLYSQPSLRSDRLIRLLTSEPGTGLDAVTEKSDKHTNFTINRNKEWWGDQGAGSDVLTINGTNVLNASTAVRTKRAIGVFAFDAGVDGQNNLVALPAFASTPFITGTDLYVPADPKGAGTVTLAQKQRNGDGTAETITVPNWPSSGHRISVQFNDYLPAQRGAKK